MRLLTFPQSTNPKRGFLQAPTKAQPLFSGKKGRPAPGSRTTY